MTVERATCLNPLRHSGRPVRVPKFASNAARSMLASRCRPASILAVLVFGSLNAHATEGGGNSYPMGVETNYNGVMLPEGAHWFAYYSHYSAAHSKINTGADNPQLARFHVSSDVVAPRLSYVWPGVNIFGAHVESRVVQAIAAVDLDAAVARPGALSPLDRGGNRAGLADMAFSPVILGWHSPSFHQTAGIDTHLKTGSYDADQRVNTGRNYAQIAMFYAFTWFPAPSFDINAKIRYATNGRNRATDYQSGDEATVEFSGGWRVTPNLAVGINGYAYRQTTDDVQGGKSVNGNGNRGKVNAIGPYVSYNVTQRLAVIAKIQSEFGARNRPQGTRVWLQARIPF